METERIIIESIREADGRRFRPSDWIERLSANMGEFGPDHRLHYAKTVHPQIIDGEKCLVVENTLREQDPSAYDYILGFARANGLRYHRVPG